MNPKNLSAARQVGAQIPRNAEAVVPRTRRPKPPPSAVHGESLHRRLSALGGSGGSVWQTLNEYVMDGNIVKKYDLQCSIKELRKFKDYNRALQVHFFQNFTLFFSFFKLLLFENKIGTICECPLFQINDFLLFLMLLRFADFVGDCFTQISNSLK